MAEVTPSPELILAFGQHLWTAFGRGVGTDCIVDVGVYSGNRIDLAIHNITTHWESFPLDPNDTTEQRRVPEIEELECARRCGALCNRIAAQRGEIEISRAIFEDAFDRTSKVFVRALQLKGRNFNLLGKICC